MVGFRSLGIQEIGAPSVASQGRLETGESDSVPSRSGLGSGVIGQAGFFPSENHVSSR